MADPITPAPITATSQLVCCALVKFGIDRSGGTPARLAGVRATLRDRLAAARLYLVCDAVPSSVVDGALRGGADVVQLRLKQARDDRLRAEAERIRALTAAHGALFILNDRPDLAAEVEADGVHVGQDDMPVSRARELVGPERLVGLSTHTPAQIDAANRSGADYIGVGPVHATPTKPGRPAVGLGLIEHAAGHATLPFFAIGGITEDNAAAVRAAGATRLAVVRAITLAEDPERAAAALRAAITAVPEVPVGAAQP